ncbi:MAG TPA: hypothetical protein PKH33_14540 [bacterium]|nr:hypothetical protein [bacterium]
MKTRMKRIHPAVIAVLIVAAGAAAFGAHASAAEKDVKEKQIETSHIVLTSPELAVDLTKKMEFDRAAGVEEKIDAALAEIERLRKVASRATIMISATLQRAPKENRRVKMTLSGGKLAKPAECASNAEGDCVFIVAPSGEKDPDYTLEIKEKRYAPFKENFRVGPGEFARIPVTIELTEAEKQKRANPPDLSSF